MTYDEALVLQSTNTNILYGENIGDIDNVLRYWIGRSHSEIGSKGYVVNTKGVDIRPIGHSDFRTQLRGVRPVIEIEKSKIS